MDSKQDKFDKITSEIYSKNNQISNQAYDNNQSNGFLVDAFIEKTGPVPRMHPDLIFTSKNELRRGIILSEILGKPKGMID